MLKTAAALTLALGAALPASAAPTAAICADRDLIVGNLEGRFAESSNGAGLSADSSLIEIWRSEATGSWTVLLTRPDGTSCIMAQGTHWFDGPLGVMKAGVPS